MLLAEHDEYEEVGSDENPACYCMDPADEKHSECDCVQSQFYRKNDEKYEFSEEDYTRGLTLKWEMVLLTRAEGRYSVVMWEIVEYEIG